MDDPLSCYLRSCDKPGVIIATGRTQDPMTGGMQLVEIGFCQEHAQQAFGDMVGALSIDPKEAPDG